MKNLISTLILAGSLVLGGCGDKEKENLVSEQITQSDLFPDKEKRQECSCIPEIVLPPRFDLRLKLIGCYDIDKDEDLDCIYKQDSTQRILLYETRDNGEGYIFAGEFSKHE